MAEYQKVNAVICKIHALLCTHMPFKMVGSSKITRIRQEDLDAYWFFRDGKPLLKWDHTFDSTAMSKDLNRTDRFFTLVDLDGNETKVFFRDWYDLDGEEVIEKLMDFMGLSYKKRTTQDFINEIVSKLTKKVTVSMDSYDLERLALLVYGHSFCFQADQECGNDTYHHFDVEKDEIDEYDREELDKYKNGGHGFMIAGKLLNDLCDQDIIEAGEYILNLSY